MVIHVLFIYVSTYDIHMYTGVSTYDMHMYTCTLAISYMFRSHIRFYIVCAHMYIHINCVYIPIRIEISSVDRCDPASAVALLIGLFSNT